MKKKKRSTNIHKCSKCSVDYIFAHRCHERTQLPRLQKGSFRPWDVDGNKWSASNPNAVSSLDATIRDGISSQDGIQEQEVFRIRRREEK